MNDPSPRLTTRVIEDPAEAAEILRGGGLVALPTETVFGLAARLDRAASVRRVFQAKQRPADNPLIVHLADQQWLERVADPVPPTARRLLDHFAPGPLTVTVPRHRDVSDDVTAGLDTVAVRIPDSELFRDVLRRLDVPLVAPSANRSGRPSPTTWQAAREELDGRIEAVLMGPPCRVGLESTVVDCTADVPRLLRPGGVTWEQLQSVVGPVDVEAGRIGPGRIGPGRLGSDQQAPDDGSDSQPVASPGMRHRHYCPTARVELFHVPRQVRPSATAMYLGLQPHDHPDQFAVHRCWPTVEQYASELFALFHRADALNLQTIFCQQVALEGLGRALMDRLTRAAQR